jgi:hypothetical protein
MAEANTITIDKADLGSAQPEFGIYDDDLKLFDTKENAILVKIFVDGDLVHPTTATEDAITLKLPPGAYGEPSTVVVTTKRDKILNVLQYEGAKKIEVRDPPDEEGTLSDIAKAIKRIAEVMNPSTSGAVPPQASRSGSNAPGARTRNGWPKP